MNDGKLYNGVEATGAAVAEVFAEQLQQKMRELNPIAQAKMTGLHLKGQGASGLQAGGGISPTAGAGKKSKGHDGPTPP